MGMETISSLYFPNELQQNIITTKLLKIIPEITDNLKALDQFACQH